MCPLHFFNRTLLCVAMLVCVACKDTEYQVSQVNENCRLIFLMPTEWEASIPVYLEAEVSGGRKLVSGPFFYGSYDDMQKKRIYFICDQEEGVIYVHTTNSPATILSMINPAVGFIYPPNYIQDKVYYEQASNMFFQLKEDLRRSDLELYR